ncbi:MAG: PKD domain-containing protein, partial [Specibacter sp.]
NWPSRPSSDYFNGSLDNFAVYNTALTASQVSSHHALGTGQGAPTASFTATPTGLAVAFNASASTAPAGQSITAYSWNFGDGSPVAAGVTVNHSYSTAGNFTAVLTVTSTSGVQATTSKVVTTVAPNQAPVAAFDAAVAGLNVSVDGSDSSDADGSVASYAWQFGDGSVGTGVTAEHEYAAAGSYTVRLVVTDGMGLASAPVTKQVSVTAPPPADLLAQDAFGRTVSNGWGSADVGGSWTLTGTAAKFQVTGGLGQVVLPPGSTRIAALKSVSSSATDSQATIALDSVPTGGGNYASMIGREVGTSTYSLKAWVKSNGSVSLVLLRDSTTLNLTTVSGLNYTANAVLNMRLQVTGTSPTTVRAKIWANGQAEPATWQASVTDATAGLQQAGGVGLGAYLAGSATTAVTTSFDNYAVTALP